MQAVVDYWVVRNAQWKAKYGTREKANEEWFRETYDMSHSRTLDGADLMEGTMGAGEAVMASECWYGPPGHRCMVFLLPVGDTGNGFTMRVLDATPCHEDCAVMGRKEEVEAMEVFARRYYYERYGRHGGAFQTFANTDELRKEIEKSKGQGSAGRL